MIEHGIEPNWSILEKCCRLEGRYLLPQILGKHYPWWESDILDAFRWVYNNYSNSLKPLSIL